MTLDELKVIITAESSGLKSALNDVSNKTKQCSDQVESNTSKIGNAFDSLKGKIAAVAGVAALKKLASDAISTASDLTEVQNVVDTAFGSMAYKAEEFASTAIDKFGMSELSAKQFSSTFMSMASGMGLTAEKASDMSLALTGMAGDVASFYNLNQDEAFNKLKSVFTGETESLKSLGIVMTETNLNAFALSQGISKTFSNMSQAEQTTLRYNYVMQQLSLAQGDFAKTSDSYANQVRVLQQRFQQLLGILGNGFIAALTPVIRVLNTLLGKLITMATVASQVLSKLFGKKTSSSSKNSIADATKSAASSLKSASASSGKTSSNLSKAAKKAKEIKGSLAGFDSLNVLSKGTSSGSTGTSTPSSTSSSPSGGGYDIGSYDWGSAEDSAEDYSKKVDEIVNKIKKYGAVITSVLSGVAVFIGAFEIIKNWSSIAAVIGKLGEGFEFVSACAEAFFGELAAGNGLFGALSAVFGTTATAAAAVAGVIALITAGLVYLYNTSKPFRKEVNTAVSNTLGLLKDLYSKVIQPIFKLLQRVFNVAIKPLANLIAKVFLKALESVSKIGLKLYNKIIVPLGKFLINTLGVAVKAVANKFEKWSPYIDEVYDVMNTLWDEVLSPLADFLTDVLCDAIDTVSDVLTPFLDLVSGVMNALVGLPEDTTVNVKATKDSAFDSIKDAWDGFKDKVAELTANVASRWADLKQKWANITDNIKDITADMKAKVASTWSDLKSKWSSLMGNFKDKAVSITANIATKVSDLKKWINTSIITPLNKKLHGIHVGSWYPLKGVSIPTFARGAVVSQPTVGVFGEAGTEAIVPLERNTQGLEKMADIVSSRINATSSNSGTQSVNLTVPIYLGDELITTKVIKNIKKQQQITGNPVFG